MEWPQRGTVHHQDRVTTIGMLEDAVPSMNGNHWFVEKHMDKRSVTMNMRDERGQELLKRLLAVSDAVLENFTSRVLQNWGLGYEQMRELNPGLVYVSMSGLGHQGRDHSYRTFGPSAQALSGLTAISGLPGEPPAGWGWSYLDDTSGIFGAIAIVSALRQRKRTGRGQHIDLSQVGLGIGLAGSAILDATVNGRPSRREGLPARQPRALARHAAAAQLPRCHRRPAQRLPHRGRRLQRLVRHRLPRRRRLAVARGPDPGNQHGLAGVGRRCALRQPRRAARAPGGARRAHRGVDPDPRQVRAAERCQAAGVPAMPVQSNEDRVEHDPQLRHRGLFAHHSHPVLGEKGYQNLPWQSSAIETTAMRRAPLAGEHNREVLCGLLGLSEDELRAGYDDGWLWPPSEPLEPYLFGDEAAGGTEDAP